MSRRKQLNPNKVHLGDNGSEEKGDLGQTSQATLTGLVDESRIQEDDDAEIESKTQTENGAESETEVITTTAQGTAVILPNNPESVDLSSVKSMMSTVMNMGSLNGEASEMPSNKSPSKSSIRAGKIKQEAKEEKSFFICPLCEKDCGTQHQLTMHIRQHNTDSGGNTHSCSICGKSLSSASSLDRHMLVHSGERPYKCSICHQAFTTNGNMHRHMKIHEKEPTSSLGSSPPSPTKRRRPSVKRKLSQEEGEAKEEESPSKKVTREVPSDEEEEKKTEEVLHCPICYKTFICKYGLESHMETHPDSTLRCNLCCISFKTHRGLLRHNAIIHKQLPTDVSGKPYIQNNPTIPVGFHDLGFIDFSCRKFPLISQVWSELNLRRCTSKFHRFVCELCNKAFPMLAALKLHLETHRGQLEGGQGLLEPQQMPDVDVKQKAFMASLGLQHAKEMKAVKREETTEFDIHTIWAETPPWKLPQEANCATVKDQPPLDLASLGASLSSLSPLQDKVKILSLHPFQKGFIIQPDSSIVVKPISSESTIEFADIQQILKMASSAPTQISLPPLSKAPSIPNQSIYRQMPPLKPKPLVAPCTVVASTPPPLMSSQQASPGCISPNLFPPPLKLVKTVAGPLCSPQDLKVKPVNGAQPFLQPKTEPLSPVEMKTQLEQDSIIEALMPMEMNGAIKQEVMEGDLKDMMTGTSSKKVPALKKVLYPCRFCNQVFAFSGVLKAHIRSHLGISPYQCNICTYIAADKAALIRHLRTHSGERPFICKICHYPFTVKANCERHLRKKHLKMTRKDIEKNIEYAESHTAELVDSFCSPDTVCKYCGEDLKYYRALRHHLRTHSSCQKKPFECRECNMGFSTKNNCIRHILKQHTHVEEKEMEKHILLVDCLVGENGAVSPTLSEESISANGSPVSCKEPQNGFMHGSLTQGSLKMEPMGIFSMDLDEPLDFSQKNKNVSFHSYKQECHLLRKHASPVVTQFDSTLEPIDLSVPKNPPKDKTNLGKENKDESQLVVNGGSFACQQCPSNFQAKTSLDKHVSTKHSSPLQGLVPTRSPATLPAVVASTSMLRPLRPKPPPPLLLPKPATGKELPPLASIAQIISSVSSAPALLKRDVKDGAEANKPTPSSDGAEDLKIGLATKATPQTGTNGPAKTLAPQHTAEKTLAGATGPGKKKGRRRSLKFKKIRPSVSSSGVDPESSGEFASVEKMLATTDTNKFSPFLQSTSVKEEPEKEEKDSQGKEKGDIITLKGKKNSYSNSVQKITCPYCPRLFPWASSLQRHMLTHTGQKPFPCPKCDAFFSTKSNCERHLLRKHGVANRSLRRNGLIARSKATDAKPLESTGNVPESEMTVTEASPAPAAAAACPSPGPPERPGAEGPTGESEPKAESAAAVRAEGGTEEQQQEAEEDAQSNKSLDLDFASKLIDFKLGSPDPGAAPAEGRNSCGVCGKTFKYAATLARHRKAHACERRRDRDARRGPRPAAEQPGALRSRPAKGAGASRSDGPPPRREDDVGEAAGAGGGAPGARAPQPPTAAGQLELRKAPPSGSNKADKRKKICAVCSKRFWSLQDLTRHMRSHTGERPYKCLTCERTFTLKHSLVRHQRIHQKGAKVAKRHLGENDDELSKDEDDSESEAEQAGSSQLSDNESETVTSISLSNDSPLPLSIAGSPVTTTASQSPSQAGVKAAEPENSLIRPATAVNGVRQGTFLIQGNDQESLKNSEKTLADSTGSSDIIQNFLGIPSGAPMNHVLGSVESTPCLLGVE